MKSGVAKTFLVAAAVGVSPPAMVEASGASRTIWSPQPSRRAPALALAQPNLLAQPRTKSARKVFA